MPGVPCHGGVDRYEHRGAVVILPAWQRVALLGGARAWTPESLGAALAWWGEAIDVGATLVKAAQPVPNDWDMEAANTAAYTAVGAISLSKVARGAGKAMRLTLAAAGNWARQNSKLTSGNRYTASFDGHGDGTSSIGLGDAANGVRFGTSTASTDWQTINGEGTCGNADMALQTVGGGAANWCEIDNISFTNLSRVRWNPRAGTLGGYLSQATAAAQRWIAALGAGYGLKSDGVADYDAISLTAAQCKVLHAATGYSMAVAILPDAGAAGVDVIWDTCGHAAAGVGITLAYDGTNQKVTFQVANGSGTWHIDASTANGSALKGAAHVIDLAWDSATGYTLAVDGVAVTGASVGAASAADATYALQEGRNGAAAEYYAGVIGSKIWATGKVSMTQARAWLQKEVGL